MNTLSKIAAALLTLGIAAAASSAQAAPLGLGGGFNPKLPGANLNLGPKAGPVGPLGGGFKVGPVGSGLTPKIPGQINPGAKLSPINPNLKIPPLSGGPAKMPIPGNGNGNKGWGKNAGYIAAGLAGAAIIGTAIAASRPAYSDGECYHVRQRIWDDEIGAYVKVRRLVCE